MNNKTKTRSLRVAIIAIALLLCFALAVGVTSALYQARRQATGTLNMDKGIVIDYKGFNKGDENIWQRETTTSFKLFEETNAQPGQEISVYPSGIRANVDSINFYARLKLEYIFYNVANGVETKVDLPNPKSLIKTSNDFFASNWVPSTDGYYYFGENTTLNQFSKDNQNFENLFADGAKFIIEGANFEGETAGEGGGFVVNGTAINKIVVYLTLETLQGDATAEQAKDLGWVITTLNEQIVDITNIPDEKPEINIDDIISDDKKDGEITITGDPTQKLTITIGSKAFYGCSKLKLTLSNSENIEYRIATDAFSSGATIMYGIDNVSSKLINPSTTGHTTVGFDGKWQVSAPGLYLFLPSPITPTTSSYGDFQYTDDQGTWYFDLIDGSGNKVDASTLSSIMSTSSVSTLGATTLDSTNNYSAKLNKFEPKDGVTTVVIPKYLGISEDSNKFAVTKIDRYNYRESHGDWTSSGSRGAFEQLVKLTSITIPDSVTSIGMEAFSFCSSLKSITIGNGVTSIGTYAFISCSGLTSITIPDSVTSIGESVFSGCSGLTSVTIGNSVTSIGRWAFLGCSGLNSIIVGSGNKAYYSAGNCLIETKSKTLILGCKNSEIPIDGSVESIGEKAFSECTSLTSITIPDSVTSIGQGAFESCSGLTSVTIGNGVTRIGSSAFNGCSGLTTITIPNSVTTIGDSAFYDCSGLTSINIGAKISEVSWLPSNVSNITVTISENNPYLATDSKAIFAKSNGELSVSKYISANTIYEIPATLNSFSVTSIGRSAFFGSGLTSIIIPGSVTSIEYYAFQNCRELTSITIPNSVTSIENYAFDGCSSLRSITIPDSVTSIGSDAFSSCSGLTSITIPDSVTDIGSSAFSGCSGLTSITIPNSVTSIGGGAFDGCSSLTSIIIPDGVISVGDYAFRGCSSLTSITIPDGVTSIGSYAFSGCSSLTLITIPDSVTSIGDSAFGGVFQGCSGLKSIVLPEGIKEIPYQCFYGCTSLESVTIPSTCTTIGDSAFQGCTNLTTVIWNISYDLGGVNATGPELSSYTGSQTSGLTMDDVIKSAPTNVESGFTFEGWSDGTNIYQPGEKITFSLANRRLTAVWSSYRVTFDANGGTGSVDSQVVSKGSSITLPSLDGFTKEGFVAVGWSTDKYATYVSYSEGQSYTPTSNVTLYVVWKKIITITFNANGGTGSVPADIKVFDGDNFTIPSASLTREGYKFLGWSWSSTATYASLTAGTNYTYYSSNGTTLYAVWGAPTTITFNANGGMGSVPADIKVFGGDNFTIPSASLTREGYKFLGWSWSSTATSANLTAGNAYIYDASNGTTLYAVWKEPTTINFDLDGGEGELPSPLTTYYGDTLTINTGKNFTKEGYKFAGWILIDESGNQQTTYGYNTTTTFYYNGSSYTLKAKWSGPQTITFYNDNTKSQSFTMTGFFDTDGITFPEGNELTKEGYILVGWDGSPNSTYVRYPVGNNYSNFSSYTELYAVWKTASECAKIVFDLSEIEGQENIIKIGYDSSFAISDVVGSIIENIRNASGQAIAGWTWTQGGSNVDMYNDNWIYFSNYQGQTKTLYPVWKNVLTINFDLNGGEGTLPESFEVWDRKSFDIPEVSLTKEGYLFAGWAWRSNSTYTDYRNGDTNRTFYESDTYGSTTLYAIWKQPLTISFDANGGTGDVPEDIITFTEGRFDIPKVNLTKDGYKFLGWSFIKNPIWGGVEYEGNGCEDRGYYQYSSKTLYAVWGNTVTYVFDLNGGTGTTPASISANYGENISVPSGTGLERAGYKFKGWSRNQNSTDYDWSSGTYTSRGVAGTITMYAVWEVLTNQVFVGSLTQAEIDAVQALWNGNTRLSELTNTSLLSSMSNNKLHSRFNILGYLNNTSLKSNTTGNSSYGISWSTRYYKLSTNTYTFEFENSLPTGWMLVNWRYEVKASGDVTIVNGRAKATIDYTYVDLSSADQSDNLMILFVLPNQPAESESVSVSISSLPGNALEAVLKGTGNEALNNLMLSGITVEIYNADGSLIWTGKPNDSNQGFVKYRFATGTYKIRFYTTNVNGVAFVDNDKGTEVTGMDISAITKGDGYSEFTINYTFAEGNPNLAIIFKMADVDVDKIMEVSAEKELSGPRNIVGNWFKGMFANMGVAFTDMTADEIKYAGYCGMLIQEYFNRSICNLPSFSIYTSDGKFVENCEYMALIAGVEYTIKFTEEVKELLIAGNDTMTIKSVTDITYNAETGTWDAKFNVFDTESSILMFFTADLDLSQYEDLPEYDATQDYSQYLEMH